MVFCLWWTLNMFFYTNVFYITKKPDDETEMLGLQYRRSLGPSLIP